MFHVTIFRIVIGRVIGIISFRVNDFYVKITSGELNGKELISSWIFYTQQSFLSSLVVSSLYCKSLMRTPLGKRTRRLISKKNPHLFRTLIWTLT